MKSLTVIQSEVRDLLYYGDFLDEYRCAQRSFKEDVNKILADIETIKKEKHLV